MAEEEMEGAPSTVHTSDDEEKMEDVEPTIDKEQPPQRLMITKIELENFKSYGGVKEIGPFHKCFSSVVGPNGSGKSNVIDAMLFVFGKRAKKLRLNKVSELIHKSDSVKNNPPTYARVSVFFQEIIDRGDGDTDYDVVPHTRRVVTRIAKKDNSSTYKLDGKNCSFRDVAAYLGSKGIDLDNNRFLILQGEVEMISMMPPKGKTEDDDGLLEYLEDIIGSSKYVEDTNLAAQKVEQLTEQRQEKLNRVKAVEKEKDNLEGAKQEAEALLGKDREIRRKRNILYQIYCMKETKAIDSLSEKKRVADEKLEAEKEQASGTKNEVKKLEKALNAQSKEYEKICNELKTTKAEFTAYERREIKLKEEIKHAKAQLKKAQTKVTTESKKEADAIKKGGEAEESIPELEEQCNELTEQKSVEDEKLDVIQDEVNEKTKEIRAKLEEKTAELAPVDQELSEFKNQLNTTRTEINLVEDSTSQNKKRLTDSEKELASLDNKQQGKKDEMTQCEGDLEKSRVRLEKIKDEENELRGKENDLRQKSNDLTRRVEEAKAALQASAGGRSHSVKKVLEAAKNGGALSKCGILGRLGDLCTTTAEYDVAVSNACGSLDHIVVRTTPGAQQILEWLRATKNGRVNCIPLDKMKKGLHDRPVNPPEDAPRLFDQITPCTSEVAPAVFMAIQNTLVAPDMTVAQRWAFDYGKRWRVVTLEGNIIEIAGTMQGGGQQVKRGLIRISDGRQPKPVPMDQASANDYKKLEKEAEKAHELLNQCRQRLRDILAESRELEKRIKQLKGRIPKLKLEIEGCDSSREQLTKLIPELRTKCELSAEEKAALKDLQKKENKIKSDMASCEKQASKLKAEVAKLQQSILDAGGSKLKKQQAACEKVESDLSDAQKALNAAKVAITSNKKAAAKAKKQKAAAEKQEKDCSESLDEKEEEFKSLQETAEEVVEAYEKVKEIEAEKKEELDTAKKECEGLKKALAEARCVEIELSGQVEAFERQISECNGRKKQWAKQIKKLLKDAEDDDEFDFSDDEDDLDSNEDENKPPANEASVDDDGDTEMKSAEESKNEKSTKGDKAEAKSSLPTFSFGVLEKYQVDDIKGDIDTLESERNTLAKNANMGAIEEYRKKEADYLSRVGELNEVTEQRNACRKEHEELRRKRLEMFMDGFGKITLKLKEMYQMITLGGDAELELVDSLDPFSEGIVFSVRPPKKSWKNISNLSGGEKTLSSLALVFALHHYKPTPLYVMDEIDAALDFKNVSIVANYIKERTKNAQFIIISLRNNMFELADRLVGIYKTSNITSSVTINPSAFGSSVPATQNGQVVASKGRASLLFGDKTNSQEVSPRVSTTGSKRLSSLSSTGKQINAA